MIEVYQDIDKVTTLFSARGTETLSGFLVESTGRSDEHQGALRRTKSGTLVGYTLYQKYRDNVGIINLQSDTLAVIEDIIENQTTVYYAPDPVNRSTELYTVKLDAPFNADYNPISKRYSMQLIVREV